MQHHGLIYHDSTDRNHHCRNVEELRNKQQERWFDWVPDAQVQKDNNIHQKGKVQKSGIHRWVSCCWPVITLTGLTCGVRLLRRLPSSRSRSLAIHAPLTRWASVGTRESPPRSLAHLLRCLGRRRLAVSPRAQDAAGWAWAPSFPAWALECFTGWSVSRFWFLLRSPFLIITVSVRGTS